MGPCFMWRKWAALGPLALVFLPPAYGGGRVVGGYFDIGKRDVFEDFDDEGPDDQYTYRTYHLQYDDTASDRLQYGGSTFQKAKTYKNDGDLDNRTSTYKGNAAYNLSTENPLLAGLDMRHTLKRFNNSPRNEFDQNVINPSLTKYKTDLYRLTLDAAVDDVRYPHAGEKDETTWSGKIGGNRYLDGGRANLTSSYSFAKTEKRQTYRERTKQDWSGKGTCKFDGSWIDKAALLVHAGQRDSKEDENYDIDYDYRYWSADAQTYHSLGADTDMTLEYMALKKDYVHYDRDHSDYSVQNQWKKVFIRNDLARFWASVLLGHQRVDFPMRSEDDLKRETVSLKAVYQRKTNWTATLLAESNFYDFRNSQKDKKRYDVTLIWNKDLLGGSLDFTLSGKYSYTDYRAKNDTERGSVRAEFEYKL